MPHGFNYTHFKDFTPLLFFGLWLLIYHNAGILHRPHSEELDQLCCHPTDPTEPQRGRPQQRSPGIASDEDGQKRPLAPAGRPSAKYRSILTVAQAGPAEAAVGPNLGV
jgi:hypothetical protein